MQRLGVINEPDPKLFKGKLDLNLPTNLSRLKLFKNF